MFEVVILIRICLCLGVGIGIFLMCKGLLNVWIIVVFIDWVM